MARGVGSNPASGVKYLGKAGRDRMAEWVEIPDREIPDREIRIHASEHWSSRNNDL